MTATLIGVGYTAFAHGPRRGGLWEIKTEMQMEGMPMTMKYTGKRLGGCTK